MASGKPVFASDIPLFYDVEEKAVKFKVERLPQLADFMRDVWENQKLQQRVVERALKRVRSETWEQTARRRLAVYEQVAGTNLEGRNNASAGRRIS